MATSLEPIEPLQIAGIREHVRARRARPPARALLVAPVAVVVAAAAVWAAVVDSSAPVGPGRVLCSALVIVWCVAAVLVALQRPTEPLPFVMTLGAAAGALAVVGATLLGRDLSSSGARDLASLARAAGLAFLPACGLHLVLGMPDGRLVTTARRVLVALGYLASLAVAVVLYGDRPELPLAAFIVLAAVDAVVALVGFIARGQRAPLSVRARFQWPAWGATVAVAIGAAVAVLNALVDWPQPIGAIAVGATVLVPISLVLGASEGLGVRIDRLLVHTITLAGLAGLVGASYLLIVLGLGRSPDSGERTLLGLSMLAAAIAALLWVPAREAHRRVGDAARVRGAPCARRDAADVREPPDARPPARRAAAPAGRVSEEDDGARRRGGLDPQRRPARARGLGARPRGGDHHARERGGDRRRACRRLGAGVGAGVAARARARRTSIRSFASRP